MAIPKLTAQLLIQPTIVGICNIHLPLDQEIAMAILMGQSELLIDHNFPYGNLCQVLHNPNLAFNHQVNQLASLVTEANLLSLVMVEQPIIHAAMSSVEMFDGTKSKFESWIASVENAAQISKQNILCIAFSKMIGSQLTSAYRLRDC